MFYKPPLFEGKPQFVPIVVKNSDFLIGYISGIQMLESILIRSLEENGIEIELKGLDLCLDSSRFNNIMEDGRRESECSESEIRKYYEHIIEEKIDIIKEIHPDNKNIFEDCFLEVECNCKLGIYIFKTPKDIPTKSFKCEICGKVIIDYTETNDEEFDYDGNILSRVKIIAEELNKQETTTEED